MKRDFIITNKAKVTFTNNATVEKEFFVANRGKKEYINLRNLHNMYPAQLYREWYYKTVKPLSYNEKKSVMTMELASGEVFATLLKRKPQVTYYTGIWFGLFHNKCREFKNYMKYIDYNRTNIFIDYSNKTITAIDPGMEYGKETSVEEALILNICGLVIGGVKSRISPKRLIKLFLKGYFEVSGEHFRLDTFNNSLDKVIMNHFTSKLSVNFSAFKKPIAYISIKILRLYIHLVTPKLIKNQSTNQCH